MSNTTIVAAATILAALAAQPAAATNNGVSEKRVRAIVKQQVAQIPRVGGPTGPAGPAGPQGSPGMDGFPSLFAHIDSGGTVEEGTASGISQENVRLVETQTTDDEGNPVVSRHYCFSDLPPLSGGQVTMSSHGTGPDGKAYSPTPHLTLQDDEIDCPTRVWITGLNRFPSIEGSFYILLY